MEKLRLHFLESLWWVIRMDLSIIVPVYNVEKYIEKNIKSLLQQNDVSIQYEVIIIDDESIDKSISIAEKLLSKSNIDYQIISQKNFPENEDVFAGTKI